MTKTIEPAPGPHLTAARAAGIPTTVLAAATYRNVRLEVWAGDGDGWYRPVVAGIVLGQINDAGPPSDVLSTLHRLVDAFHITAGNPGDPNGG